MTSERVDWYILRSGRINAYAVGGHSVAVSSQLIDEHRSGRLADADILALLVHELGHVTAGGVRYGLLTDWYLAPWRAAGWLVVEVPARMLGFARHRGLLAGVLTVGLATAMVRGLAQHAWSGVVVLSGMAVLAVAVLLAAASCSRATERAADRFTAQCGLAGALARALSAIDDDSKACGPMARALRRHPPLSERVDALLVADGTPSATASN